VNLERQLEVTVTLNCSLLRNTPEDHRYVQELRNRLSNSGDEIVFLVERKKNLDG
jgi:hypothetical protein